MTRLGSVLACLTLLVLGAPPGMASATQNDDRVLSYVGRVEVSPDGTVTITERISYRFATPRHGDFRLIPVWYPLPPRPDGIPDGRHVRTVEIDFYSALMDGRPVPFARDRGPSEGTAILRVGDQARTITGEHDVELSYRMTGLIIDPEGRPELYWEASDFDDPLPVDRAEVTVTAPGPVGEVRCVVGAPGDDRRRSCTRAQADGQAAQFVAEHASPHLPMRITVALPHTVAVSPINVRELPNFGVPQGNSGPRISWFTVALTVFLVALAASVVGRAFHRLRRRR